MAEPKLCTGSVTTLRTWSGVLCSLLECAAKAERAFDEGSEDDLLAVACEIAQLYPVKLSNNVVPILKDLYNRPLV